MKKTMRRLTAAMLALTCVTATAAPAVYAEEPNLTWYWGTAETDDFANMERVDDGNPNTKPLAAESNVRNIRTSGGDSGSASP